MNYEDMTPAEKSAYTRKKNSKKNQEQITEAQTVQRLSAVGFTAAQIEALRALFKAA